MAKWMMGWFLLSFAQRWISVFHYGNGNKRIQNDSERSRLSGEIGWHSASPFNQERGLLCALPPGWLCQFHVPPRSARCPGAGQEEQEKESSSGPTEQRGLKGNPPVWCLGRWTIWCRPLKTSMLFSNDHCHILQLPAPRGLVSDTKNN